MVGIRPGAMSRLCLILVGLLPVAVCTFDVSAQPETQEFRFRSKIRAGKPPDTPNRIAEHWWWGGQAELEMERTRDQDLDSREDDDRVVADPTLQLALAYQSDTWLSGFLDLELGKEYLLEDPDGRTSRSTRLEIVESWLQAASRDGSKRLRLGRQDFEDERAWFLDEELDGGRAYLKVRDVTLELSVTRRNWFSRDLLNSTDNERINNYLALARFENDEEEDDETSLYTLYRDGRRPNSEDLLFGGLQSVGEFLDDADYWLNVSGVVGDSDGDNVRGYGIDAGLVYSLDDVPLEPSITPAFAYGSREFTQTGLHDNDAEMSGVIDIKYYGYAFDPELSNLLILTLDLGVQPTEESSIELVYHYYRQADSAPELRDSNLEVDPDGEHRDLGQGLDIIFGYAPGENLEIEVVGGWFFPGDAFENDASTAFFGGLQVLYQF